MVFHKGIEVPEKQEIAAIILAAGKGTRMKSDLPKVMHRIAGKPMLGFVLDAVKAIGASKVVAVIGPQMESVREYVIKTFAHGKVAIQKTQKGTGDAVKAALPELKGFTGTALVLYGDTPFVRAETIVRLIGTLKQESDAVAVLGFRPADPAEYGRLALDKRGNLERIVEFKDATQAERAIPLCNSGVMAVRGAVLKTLLDQIKNTNAKKEYYLTDIVELALAQGYACRVAEAEEGEVMGINSRGQLAEAEAMLQNNLRQRAMANGVTMIAPETVFLCEDTRFGKDVVVHPHVVFGPGVTVRDNAEVKSFSHVEGATLDSGAAVGPFARLRPGAMIGEDARVGNFVEIKKSTIGKGSKVGHLTYIGDAAIGEEVNIGAGTVTCNYDGFHKYVTEIGDGAFIGSNTSLVAPVKIGEGAIVGAGSTIRKDVAPGALAHDGKPQLIKLGGAEKLRRAKNKSCTS